MKASPSIFILPHGSPKNNPTRMPRIMPIIILVARLNLNLLKNFIYSPQFIFEANIPSRSAVSKLLVFFVYEAKFIRWELLNEEYP
jgi:hypothetical protein